MFKVAKLLYNYKYPLFIRPFVYMSVMFRRKREEEKFDLCFCEEYYYLWALLICWSGYKSINVNQRSKTKMISLKHNQEVKLWTHPFLQNDTAPYNHFHGTKDHLLRKIFQLIGKYHLNFVHVNFTETPKESTCSKQFLMSQ